MRASDVLQIALFIALLIGLAVPLGAYMAKVFAGERTWLSRPLGWLERLVYRVGGVDAREELTWVAYAKALLAFNIIGFVALFVLQLAQGALPLNPRASAGASWHLALNTAVSFVTNTNWQSYAGETAMSDLTQMAGLAVQNFLSAATGFAAFLALTRGISRRGSRVIGSFWVDLTRATIYVLLPLSFVLAIALVSQGTVQSFAGGVQAHGLERASATIPLGPVASQVAIKQLGTNGGGFFNANGAHPFENPTPLSNLLQMLAILLLPAALPFAYGRLTGARRHARTIFAVMLGAWLLSLGATLAAEFAADPVLGRAAILEGKELRFGVANSVLWSSVTTVASNGSVNSMISSLSPLAGGLAMFNIMLGEVIFGGVGAGMYGMLLFVLLTVFLAGLMVGRSPEYLGKKIEAAEMKMAILGILGPCAAILLGAALSVSLPAALAGVSSKGPHGLSEILYAWTSAAGNNGSAFAGLSANSPYWNVALALAMLIGRFVVLLPVLAIAGRLAAKNASPPSAGTFETDTPVFAVLLLGVIAIVGALTFVPALALGPIVEHFLMMGGRAL